MANRYWVGSSGNWSDAANHWSNASGGSPNASYLPTANDDVYFDAASNGAGTGAFTVTVDGTSASPSLCASFLTGGAGGALDGAMTLSLGATAQLDVHGSLTLPATNFTWTATSGAILRFRATTTGQTITTNGVTLTAQILTFDGVGGEWTLGSALSWGTGNSFNLNNGSFVSANYNLTGGGIFSQGSGTRSLSLGSSSVTYNSSTPLTFSGTNFTFNAGTSTITCSATSPTFAGGGQTFYNVSFTSSSSGAITISGANTYNNLTFTSLSVTNIRNINLSANQTINGTFTPGAANASVKRLYLRSDTVGTARTITVNGTVGTLSDIDFRDITAVGSTPWTGTRLGDSKGNSGITFSTPKTVYWNLAGSKLWSDTGWATTNNGVPDANNFPLAQDTATFTEAGAAGTVAFDTGWQIGSIQMADGVSNRTTAFTLNYLSNISVYGNITLFSGLTLTGTATVNFNGQGVTQTFTSAGLTLTQPITVQSATGTLQLQDNLTLGSTLTTTLTSGTLDLNGKTLSTGYFNSSASTARTIAFGTGNITITGNAVTVWTTSTTTNFSYTGTSAVNFTYAGSAGTRTITTGALSAAQALNFNITGGSDTIAFSSTNSIIKNLIFSGFTGTVTNTNKYIYGDTQFNAGMTLTSGTNGIFFSVISGIQKITTAGLTLDFPITFDGVGGTFQLQDNMTVGSTRTVTLTNGTLDLTGNSGNWTLSTGLFASSNSNTRAIAFGTGNITVTGNNATIWSMGTATGFTYTGTPSVNFTYSGSTGTRTITGGGTELTSVSFNIATGTDIVSINGSMLNLTFTGYSGQLALAIRTVYGNLTFSSTMTTAAGAGGTTTFASTSGVKLINLNGVVCGGSFTFDGVGGTWKLVGNTTLDTGRTITHTNGTIDLDGNTLTTGVFISSNSNVRGIAFGTGNITVNNTAGGTIFSTNTVTNLTITGTPVVNVSANTSVASSIITGAPNENNAISFNFTTGTYSANFLASSGHAAKNVNFSGFSGSWTNASAGVLYGNLTLSATMTVTSSTNVLTFKGTSGPYTITTNGKTLDFPVTFDGIGGTWTMADALTLGSTRALTMTNGTLQLKAGTTNTVGSFATSGTNLKYLTSTVAGSQATLSDASGTNNVSYLSIKDNVATGGAGWDAFTSNGNVDAGNNVGWVFDPAPAPVLTEYYMELRSFTEPRRF